MSKNNKDLFSAILSLKSEEELKKFFKDLCTPAELRAMQERWKVCKILASRDLSYRDIYKETGISLTTIGRVARFLNQEDNQGYKLVLDRMNIEDKRHLEA